MAIECDRCKCEIDFSMTECIETHKIDEDFTEIDDMGEVWRFCKPCWDEIMAKLFSEGMIK